MYIKNIINFCCIFRQIEFYPEDDPYNPITRRVDSPTSYVTFPNVRPGNYVIKISASKSNLDSPQTEVVKAMRTI